jgi:hypothetical protein
MPYQAPASKGAKASYCGPVVINWWAGHRRLEPHSSLTLSPTETISLGFALGNKSINTEAEQWFIETMGRIDVDESEALKLLYFSRGVCSLL